MTACETISFTHTSTQNENIVWEGQALRNASSILACSQETKWAGGAENRMRALSDNGATSFYVYDAQNIRVLKGSISGQQVYLNGKPSGGGGGAANYTVYVNPYLVLKSGSYTKHYFIESQRIVSKLGDTPNLGKTAIKAGGNTVNYGEKKGKVWETIVKNLKFLGEDGELLTAGNSGKTPPGQITGQNGNSGGSTGVGSTEQFQYFYHPDHVGSTSYITDAAGEVYQHLEYFPFGETFVEEHSNTNKTPYLFNGKELDEETGLYYYGARYYDPVTSVWLGVDPLAIAYPSMSVYSFTANNPINYVDPDGRKIKGVTYNAATNTFTYTAEAKAAGVETYVNARLKTEGGRQGIMRMVNDDRTFNILLTDEVLFGEYPDGEGGVKYTVIKGQTEPGEYIAISTAGKKNSDFTSTGSPDDVIVVNVLEDGKVVQKEIKRSSIRSTSSSGGSFSKQYEKARKKSGAFDYYNNPNDPGAKPKPGSEADIHRIGAHEETHLFEKGYMSVFKSEKKAFENEVKERREYRARYDPCDY